MFRITKQIVIVLLLIAVVAGASFFVGSHLGYEKRVKADVIGMLFENSSYEIPDIDFSILLDAWNIIDEKYVSEKPSDEDRLWGMVSGLVSSIGDPYSVFLPPKEAATFEEDIRGNFGGVGIEIGMRDGILTVVSPLKGTPAYNAGIEPGDKIIEVDGESTLSITIDEAVSMIRGEIGTTVTLTIFREGTGIDDEGETIDFDIKRANIEIPTIDTEIKDGVYIIKLYNFSGKANQLFELALRDYGKRNINKLIIDLRGNPGGYLEAAIDIASMFLSEGKPIVIEDMGEGNQAKTHRSKGYKIISNVPEKVVVLVNEGSASASEILAAALSEHGVATLVGQETFGKGSVQEIVELTKDTFIKITVAQWLTPNGISLSEESIKPQVEVKISKEDREKGIDTQLEKALEIINS